MVVEEMRSPSLPPRLIEFGNWNAIAPSPHDGIGDGKYDRPFST